MTSRPHDYSLSDDDTTAPAQGIGPEQETSARIGFARLQEIKRRETATRNQPAMTPTLDISPADMATFQAEIAHELIDLPQRRQQETRSRTAAHTSQSAEAQLAALLEREVGSEPNTHQERPRGVHRTDWLLRALLEQDEQEQRHTTFDLQGLQQRRLDQFCRVTAQQLLDRDDMRALLGRALRDTPHDPAEIAGAITPVLLQRAAADAFEFPLLPTLFAAIALEIAQRGGVPKARTRRGSHNGNSARRGDASGRR